MMFVKGYTIRGFEGQTFHVHVRYPGIHKELIFRDYLITHPQKAKEYETLKFELKNKYPYNRDGYTEAKGDFIRDILMLAETENA